MTRKLFITALLTFAAASANADVTYLLCTTNGRHPQTLGIDFTKRAVIDFTGQVFPAKITDASVIWVFETPDRSFSDTRTLSRYTGVVTFTPARSASTPVCEVKASKKF